MINDSKLNGTAIQSPDPLPVMLLLAGAFLLYLVTLQNTLYGDGIFYLARVVDGKLAGHHPLYPPILALTLKTGNLLGLTPMTSGNLLSALTGAGGVAFSYPFFRQWLGGRKGIALFGSLLLMLSPVTWFFSTTIENHALHFLFVILFLVTLTRAANQGRTWPALLPGMLLVPAFLAHTSLLMLIPFALTAFFMHWGKKYTGENKLLAAAGCVVLLLAPVGTIKILLPDLYTLINQGTNPFHGHDPSAETLKVLMARAEVEPGLVNWLWHNPIRLIAYTWEHAWEMATHVYDDYLVHSAIAGIISLFGVIPALFLAREKGCRLLLLLLLAFLPYAWIWSFWGFQPPEKGAYYLPILPITLAAGLAGAMPLLQRIHHCQKTLLITATLLLFTQAGFGLHIINTYTLGKWRHQWSKEAVSLVKPGNDREGIVVTGDGHLLFYLRYYHGNSLHAALYFDELIPLTAKGEAARSAGRQVINQARQYLKSGQSIFIDNDFWIRAEKYPAFLTELQKLPWRTTRGTRAKGKLLP